MKFTSQTTTKGNSSYSYVSQEDAEINAASLDSNGCINCISCRSCVDCINCRDCVCCDDCNGYNG